MTNAIRSKFDTKTIVLAMILTSQLMIVLDLSITITALPHIRSQLDFSSTGLSWVQNATRSRSADCSCSAPGLGDILGRRRMFMVGLGIFTAASLSAALAQTSEWLLIARATQGIGAAIAAPSTLALLTTIFEEGRERTRAIASYATISAAGGSIGLLVGGALTDLISWRWGFFINVPIGLTLIALAPRFLPPSASAVASTSPERSPRRSA